MVPTGKPTRTGARRSAAKKVSSACPSSVACQQSYYLNFTTDFDGADRQPHSVYKNDYTVTIAIPGQAQLDFYTIDGDHHQVTNNGTMTVPDLTTPQPYNGNFLEFTLLDVAVRN